ncbi:tetratricopeptide repeat protein [aff. Roholtiella sp. LEGE 12411]|uniref:tetratricopeptide repeat protein n=1 Tax=aff. Roholtiella sp. LEGE 12411 TaxID=1828822 RepID=UPI001881C897|nr:hypothetical protein [aff. Roholtiella sp. LEGE 12411]MBE9037017.1 hypothetical protein [aff. Roholtiella sp. LEGE 12411]
MRISTKFIILSCLSFLLIKDVPLLASVPLIRVRRNQVRCNPALGRVMNKGDKRFEPGSLVCQGEQLEVLNGDHIKFLCLSSGDILNLSSGAIPRDKCAITDTSASTCNPSNLHVCLIRKGGNRQDDEPTIIYPYTSSLMKTRPDIAWRPVPGATSYKVRVKGSEFEWETIVDKTRITYPPEEKELAFDQAFNISVIAYRKDYPPTADSFVVNLFSEQEIKRVLDTVEQINSLSLPQDEAALDIDAVYVSRGFLDESLEILTKVATAGSKNSTIYRVLGERYFEAGLPDEAKRQYLIASELAKNSNNSFELKKVESGLKIIDFYNQLPTKRKGAQ